MFTYETHLDEFPSAFHGWENTTVAWSIEANPAWHIPGDGHPNAEGNRHFSDVVTERFLTTPALRELR